MLHKFLYIFFIIDNLVLYVSWDLYCKNIGELFFIYIKNLRNDIEYIIINIFKLFY